MLELSGACVRKSDATPPMLLIPIPEVSEAADGDRDRERADSLEAGSRLQLRSLPTASSSAAP